jgi:ArsR family transcriptional regulator
MTENPLSPEVLRRIAERLKALADPTRLAVLHSLQEGERCVGEVAEAVGSSQANVSKHLGVLRKAGLVRSRRDGMNVYYAVADEAAFQVCRLMCGVVERRARRELDDVRSVEPARRAANHGRPRA